MDLSKWLKSELSDLLECDIGMEYSENILKIETEPEIREFIASLLDLTIPKNRDFLSELLTRLNKNFSNTSNMTVYMKPDMKEENIKSRLTLKKQSNKYLSEEKESDKKSSFNQINFIKTSSNIKRQTCDCQATKHKLVSNCLSCGRIICELEGSGPCFFCSNLVGTREEMEKISRQSRKGENLKADLLKRTWDVQNSISEESDEKLRKAIEHKNKLIDFDRTSAKRTQVIDDESDYFNTNSNWLTYKQKSLLRTKEQEFIEKKFGSKITKSFTFDFAGRKVIDDNCIMSKENISEQVDEILNMRTIYSNKFDAAQDISLNFVEENNFIPKSVSITNNEKNGGKIIRIQDMQLNEMRDNGMCLSMHQPYASLLVAGIKKHEGRNWYAPYRGRLWIHAGSKKPSESDIKEIETFYKCFHSNNNIKFPDSYPTSCLLGYVDLIDCQNSETYKSSYPKSESDSEFVFICENPRELVVKIQMPGQHKIFKINKAILNIANKTLVYDGKKNSN